MITWNEKQFLEDMPDIELFKRRVEKSLKDVMTRGILCPRQRYDHRLRLWRAL